MNDSSYTITVSDDDSKLIFTSHFASSQQSVCLVMISDGTTNCYFPTSPYQSQTGGLYLGGSLFAANYEVLNDGIVIKQLDLNHGSITWSHHMKWTNPSSYKYSPMALDKDGESIIMITVITIDSSSHLGAVKVNKTTGELISGPTVYSNNTNTKSILRIDPSIKFIHYLDSGTEYIGVFSTTHLNYSRILQLSESNTFAYKPNSEPR